MARHRRTFPLPQAEPLQNWSGWRDGVDRGRVRLPERCSKGLGSAWKGISDAPRLSGQENGGAPQVQRDAEQMQVTLVLAEAEITHAGEAIVTLQHRKDRLDATADPADQLVAPPLPERQHRVVPVGPVHDPVLDAARLQR